jgi:hypothetical protein
VNWGYKCGKVKIFPHLLPIPPLSKEAMKPIIGARAKKESKTKDRSQKKRKRKKTIVKKWYGGSVSVFVLWL